MTLVKFYYNEKENDLFAFFPQLNHGRFNDGFKVCYAHLGQHSSCHIDYLKECRLATKKEYSDLANELKSIGYELKILNK